MRMKPPHAVALVLVSWYLILPPVRQPYDTPISSWTKIGSYDSSKDCDDARSKLVSKSADVPPRETADLVVRSVVLSRCVADNDPSLRPK
jgi:hypothetical protein